MQSCYDICCSVQGIIIKFIDCYHLLMPMCVAHGFLSFWQQNIIYGMSTWSAFHHNIVIHVSIWHAMIFLVLLISFPSWQLAVCVPSAVIKGCQYSVHSPKIVKTCFKRYKWDLRFQVDTEYKACKKKNTNSTVNSNRARIFEI